MISLRSWLMSVTACAMFVSIAEQVTHGGTMRRAVRFTGGLLLMLALLRPLITISMDVPAFSPFDYHKAVAEVEKKLAAQRNDALNAGIAQETRTYIEDKAAELGLSIRASVKIGERSGESVPVSVTLYGEKSTVLGALLAQELGITEEHQTWIETKQESPP